MNCWFCNKEFETGAEGPAKCPVCKMWFVKDKDGNVISSHLSREGAEARMAKTK
ncbi:hypothetical protein LCGC14_0236520 [marine sediment metagenome]|uniref:Uncharacterized protein n=1 Tax=marine sediment metagenome TaxID=412755 RepID=A0A0F9UDT0_9ZZZZ